MDSSMENGFSMKVAQEVEFSRKRNKTHHPDIILNGNPIK